MAYEIDISQLVRFGQGMTTLGSGRVVELARPRFRAMGEAVLKQARGNINNRSGKLSRSGTNEATGPLEQTVRFSAMNRGFDYAGAVEFGRGPVVARPGKMLRFEIGGQVLFRKRVGPAKAQRVLERGIQQAMPVIDSQARQLEGDCARAVEAI